MENIGVLQANLKERAVLRVCSDTPFSSEITADQVGVLADIAERYGSGYVHVTARQTVEIPDVETAYLKEIKELLHGSGLALGSTDTFTRNVMACSKWCLYNVEPVDSLTQRLNNRLREKRLPGKTNISISGCDFSCSRSRTSDIGLIACADIQLTDKKCKNCMLCVVAPLGCQVEAIVVEDGGKVTIDMESCIKCGFCTGVCKPGTIEVVKKYFDIYVGGNGGVFPREAVFLKGEIPASAIYDETLKLVDRYCSLAKPGERIGQLIDRIGIDALK